MASTEETVQVYTDGSCLRNPGPGGWAFLVLWPSTNKKTECSGGEPQTTNNRMELRAVIEALVFIESFNVTEVTVHTDSLLVLNCAQGKWKRKANLDMWKEYDQVSCEKRVRWQWVRGHNGNVYNERVDKLARNKAVRYNDLK